MSSADSVKKPTVSNDGAKGSGASCNRNQAEARLEPADSTVRSGPQDRTEGLRSDGERDHAGGDGRSRPSRGASAGCGGPAMRGLARRRGIEGGKGGGMSLA